MGLLFPGTKQTVCNDEVLMVSVKQVECIFILIPVHSEEKGGGGGGGL